jgi:hypothetical protein
MSIILRISATTLPQGTSDVYSKQTIWYILQDDAIHLINNILSELKSDLKQEIDKSLDHPVMSLASSIRKPNNFDEFYNRVLEREGKIHNHIRFCLVDLEVR